MRAFLTLISALAALVLCAADISAAPGQGVVAPTMVQPVQYGGPLNGDYPWYRHACHFGYHYVCVREYSGYRRCGCQADVLYSPNPYYAYRPWSYDPWRGYDLY